MEALEAEPGCCRISPVRKVRTEGYLQTNTIAARLRIFMHHVPGIGRCAIAKVHTAVAVDVEPV